MDILSLVCTNVCNLSCRNCFSNANSSIKNEMGVDLATMALEEAKALGCRKLSFTGGEPFLWKPIWDLTERGLRGGFEFLLINTNGTALSREEMVRLSEYGDALRLSFSLNGPDAIHDATRGRGNYRTTLRAIELADRCGVQYQIYTVVDRGLMADLPRWSDETLRRFGRVETMFFIQLRAREDGSFSSPRLKLLPSEFVDTVRLVSFLRLAGYPVEMMENPLVNAVSHALGLAWMPRSPRISRPGKIVLFHDGTLRASHSSMDALGTFHAGAFGEIMASDPWKAEEGAKGNACSSCVHVGACRASGMLYPSDEDHNVGDGASPFCAKVMAACV